MKQATNQDTILPILPLLETNQLIGLEADLLSSADSTTATVIEAVLSQTALLPAHPYTTAQGEVLARLFIKQQVASAAELLGRFLSSPDTPRELLGSSQIRLFGKALLQADTQAFPLAAKGLATVLLHNEGARLDFAGHLASDSTLPSNLMDALLVFVKSANQVSVAKVAPLVAPIAVRAALGGSASALKVVELLAVESGATLEALRSVTQGLEPSQVTAHHLRVAFVAKQAHLDQATAVTLLDRTLLWLVRRFAEDSVHEEETRQLVEATSMSEGSQFECSLVEQVIFWALSRGSSRRIYPSPLSKQPSPRSCNSQMCWRCWRTLSS